MHTHARLSSTDLNRLASGFRRLGSQPTVAPATTQRRSAAGYRHRDAVRRIDERTRSAEFRDREGRQGRVEEPTVEDNVTDEPVRRQQRCDEALHARRECPGSAG